MIAAGVKLAGTTSKACFLIFPNCFRATDIDRCRLDLRSSNKKPLLSTFTRLIQSLQSLVQNGLTKNTIKGSCIRPHFRLWWEMFQASFCTISSCGVVVHSDLYKYHCVEEKWFWCEWIWKPNRKGSMSKKIDDDLNSKLFYKNT